MRNTGKSYKAAPYGNGSSSNNNNKTFDARLDRKSATGMNGSPKKGGHGGKFTWIGGDGFYSHEEMGRHGGGVAAADLISQEEEVPIQTP